jgi:hypothetical protein
VRKTVNSARISDKILVIRYWLTSRFFYINLRVSVPQLLLSQALVLKVISL